jgi:hypothetical protein
MVDMAQYRIVGRCMDGVHVVGYVLMDLITGERRIVTTEETHYLVLNKQVDNCKGQLYNGQVYLKGVGCKLIDLPTYDKYGRPIEKVQKVKYKPRATAIIIGRILNDRNVIGYIVQAIDSNGNVVKKRLKREEVIKLAREGKIANARVQMFNGEYILRGVGCNLSQLPAVNI